MNTLHFRPISLDLQDQYLERLTQCPQIASDYSFVNLWGWAAEHGLYWAWSDQLIWIKQTRPHTRYWAPVGSWNNVYWNHAMAFLAEPEPVRFTRIPETLVQQWKPLLQDQALIIEARGHWDYLYAAADLASLKGNRFHKKKNLVNQFKRRYDFTYQSFSEKLVDQAIAMQEDWCTWRDCESSETLSAENRVIARVLRSWNNLKHLVGGAILSDNRMVAYTVGERLPNGDLLIHFEKADQEFKGAYQAINQMFVANLNGTFDRVNREQDLNDPGLRKAKLSYHPVDFLKKFQVTLKRP